MSRYLGVDATRHNDVDLSWGLNLNGASEDNSCVGLKGVAEE